MTAGPEAASRGRVAVHAIGAATGGFSDAVWAPAGPQLHVSGVTSRDPDGAVHAPGDPGAQMSRVLVRLASVLAAADLSLADVYRVQVMVRDMSHWPLMHAAFDAAWGGTWPACTLSEVSRLFDAEQLVEVEAVAVAPT